MQFRFNDSIQNKMKLFQEFINFEMQKLVGIYEVITFYAQIVLRLNNLSD